MSQINHQSSSRNIDAEAIKSCLAKIEGARKVITDSLAAIDLANKVISDNQVWFPSSFTHSIWLTVSRARISTLIDKPLSTLASPRSSNDSQENDDERDHSDSPQSQPVLSASGGDLRCPDCGKANPDEKARRRHYATRKPSTWYSSTG